MSLFEKIIQNIKKIYTEHFLHWVGVKIVLFLILFGIIAIVTLVVAVMIWSSYTSEASSFSTQREHIAALPSDEALNDSSASKSFQTSGSLFKTYDEYDDDQYYHKEPSFKDIFRNTSSLESHDSNENSAIIKFLTDIFSGLGVV